MEIPIPRPPVEYEDETNWAGLLKGVKLPEISVNKWGNDELEVDHSSVTVDQTALLNGYEHFDIKNFITIDVHTHERGLQERYYNKNPAQVSSHADGFYLYIYSHGEEQLSEINKRFWLGVLSTKHLVENEDFHDKMERKDTYKEIGGFAICFAGLIAATSLGMSVVEDLAALGTGSVLGLHAAFKGMIGTNLEEYVAKKYRKELRKAAKDYPVLSAIS
jgi:hypothetical protein